MKKVCIITLIIKHLRFGLGSDNKADFFIIEGVNKRDETTSDIAAFRAQDRDIINKESVITLCKGKIIIPAERDFTKVGKIKTRCPCGHFRHIKPAPFHDDFSRLPLRFAGQMMKDGTNGFICAAPQG